MAGYNSIKETISNPKWYSLVILYALVIIGLFVWLDGDSEPIDEDSSEFSHEDLGTDDDVQIPASAIGSRGDSGCEDSACHEGIEGISPDMQFECTVCHQGDDETTNKTQAHEDMYPNPTDMSIVEETCGLCHGGHVSRLQKSLHATSAGVISGSRYTWGVQDKNSYYANYAVEDLDGYVPLESGALASLDQIPKLNESNAPVDDYLRNQCLRCHVGTEGAKRDADYRSSGCAACHVVYADDGKYTGNDPTVNKTEGNHPIQHKITSKIPAEQCIHCHNRGGRTGVSYIGTMESDGYGTPFTEEGGKQSKLHGKYYNHLSADLHYEKGMQCIDCHTSQDIHGDGNIYAKKEYAVEIECDDCHGTPDEYPWDEDGKITTSGGVNTDGTPYGVQGGNEFTNIEKRGDTLILISKYDGVEHEIPVIRSIEESDSWKNDGAEVSMSSVPHIDKLECYACHASWTPQCYGCHAKMDERQDGFDWVDGEADETNNWQESRSYLRWETPILGINSEGKVAPFIPGCQVIFTSIDEDGNAVVSNKVYTTQDGYSGIAHNPIQPHTMSSTARICEDCHTSLKTLGLGTGTYNSTANGLDIDFELERIVDEDGNQLQATSHIGSRPFNKAEQQKISRVGLCIGCHQSYSDPVWNDVTDVVGFASNAKAHESIMGFALSSVPPGEPMEVFLASNAVGDTIFLEWNLSDPTSIDHYEIYWSTSSITDVSTIDPNATTTNDVYVVEGIETDRTYHFAIVAVDVSGNTSGVVFTNEVLMGDTGSGNERMVISVSDETIDLEWNLSGYSNIDHYEIYWSTSEIDTITNIEPNAVTTEDFHTARGLKSDTTYYFAVVAVDESGETIGTITSTEKTNEVSSDDSDQAIIYSMGFLIILLICLSIFLITKVNSGMPEKVAEKPSDISSLEKTPDDPLENTTASDTEKKGED